MQESQRFSIEVLPVLGKPAAAIEPSESTLDDPAFGQDHESLGVIGTLDDFGFEIREHADVGTMNEFRRPKAEPFRFSLSAKRP